MDIYIHNEKVELYPNTVIAVSYQNSLIGELKSLRANHSNRIKIPKTAHNSRILELLSVKTNTSNKPYERIPCFILDRGITTQGHCVVTKSTRKHFELVFYSGAVTFFGKLKGKTLRDLDLAEYNHVLSPLRLFGSFTNTDGYIYAFAKFIKNKYEGGECQYWLPSVFEHTLFRKMMDMTGYSFYGTEEMNRNLVIAPANGVERNLPEIFDEKLYSNRYQFSYDIPPDETEPDLFYYHKLPSERALCVVTVSGEDRSYIQDNGQEDRFDTEIWIHHKARPQGGGRVFIRQGDTAISHEDTVKFEETYTFFSEDYYKHPVGNDYVELDYRMKIRRWQGPVVVGTAVRDFDVKIKIERLDISQEIKLSDILPNIKLLDFLKEIMVRNGYMLKIEESTKTCLFKKLDRVAGDTANALDWSGKLVEVKSETYKLGKYYKHNKADYADNSQVLLFDLQNETLPDSGSVLKSIYGKPDKDIIDYELTYLNFIEVVEHLIYSTSSESSEFPKDLKPEKAAHKIFSLDRVYRKLDMRSYGIDSTRKIYEGVVPHLSPEEVRINEEFNKNCNTHKNMADKPLVVRADFFIKQIDILELDFFRMIYLKQYSKYFILNKIINYKGEGVTECELIAVKPRFSSHGYGYGHGYGNTNNLIIGEL